MGSLCAICERPIIRPQRFVLTGTEAVHAECLRSGGMTVLQRLREQLDSVRADLAAERRATTDANIRERRERERADAAARMGDKHRRELQRTTRDLEDARAAGDAARAELAARVALDRPSSPARQETTQTDQAPSEHKDGTVIRMSLLELD